MTRARQLREFWKHLAVLIDSGLPAMRSLNIIYGSFGGAFAEDLRSMIETIQGGETFSEAMAKTNLFSRAEINIVRGGEVGGMLEVCLQRLAKGGIMTRADQYESCYRTLGTLITSGVPILQSLRIAGENCDEPLKAAFEKILDSIREGGTIAAVMEEFPHVFSPLDMNLVDAGEENGDLDLMLLKLADLCAKD